MIKFKVLKHLGHFDLGLIMLSLLIVLKIKTLIKEPTQSPSNKKKNIIYQRFFCVF